MERQLKAELLKIHTPEKLQALYYNKIINYFDF